MVNVERLIQRAQNLAQKARPATSSSKRTRQARAVGMALKQRTLQAAERASHTRWSTDRAWRPSAGAVVNPGDQDKSSPIKNDTVGLGVHL